MYKKVDSTLSESLYNHLQQLNYVTLSTVDFETGAPNVSTMSWVWAKDHQCILFAVGKGSRIVENIRNHPHAVISVICDGTTYAIAGKAQICQEKMADVQIPLSLIKMEICEVRDIMFYGAKIVQEPTYQKTYQQELADKLDLQVIEQFRKTQLS